MPLSILDLIMRLAIGQKSMCKMLTRKTVASRLLAASQFWFFNGHCLGIFSLLHSRFFDFEYVVVNSRFSREWYCQLVRALRFVDRPESHPQFSDLSTSVLETKDERAIRKYLYAELQILCYGRLRAPITYSVFRKTLDDRFGSVYLHRFTNDVVLFPSRSSLNS